MKRQKQHSPEGAKLTSIVRQGYETERAKFAWQDGYGAFSVSQSVIEKTIEYIKTQEEHHKKADVREELISLLNAYNIEYDDRYI